MRLRGSRTDRLRKRGQTERQKNRQTERMTNREREREREKDKHTEREKDEQTYWVGVEAVVQFTLLPPEVTWLIIDTLTREVMIHAEGVC